MKIAYLSAFYPYRGGIAQFNASLFRALQERHNVSAFNFSRQYPNILFPGTSQYVDPGDRADPVENRRTLDSINPFSFYHTARRIKEHHPDLLIISYWMSFFAPSLGTVAHQLKPFTRVVSILHNVIPHEPKFFDRPLVRFFLRQSHGSVVMSSASEAELLSITSRTGRYVKIPMPIHSQFGKSVDRTEARKRLGIPEGKRMLLFFGLIRHYKGVDLLIKAMDNLDDRYVLVIAGETYGNLETYRKLIDGSKLSSNILFFNEYIPDSRVAEFFSAADVCVLPYRSATQSAVTTIAYQFDIPVISTNVGGLSEDVGDRGTGLVVDRPDPGSIAEGIRTYFDKGMKPGCVSNIARVKAGENWSKFAEKLTAFAATL